MRRHMLIVLGMHRSGTSALAGMLARAGAFPGRELMPATAANPEGYWECLPIVRFNDRLLAQLGARWDSIASLPSGWPALSTVQALRSEAAQIVASQFADTELAVLKDPRLCRLLPFWHEVFADSDFVTSFALMVRRPAEVAASLARRDQFAPEKSLLLWLSHLCDAERDSRGHSRSLVSYDALLADPDGALGRVCEELSFPLRPEAAQRQAAASVVRPELKRQRRGDGQVPPRATLASGLDSVLDELYARLVQPAPGKDCFPAIAASQTTARAAIAAAVPPWIAEELAATQALAQRYAAEIDAARRDTDDLARQIETARAAHVALQEHIARAERDLGDERVTIAKLTQEVDVARLAAIDQQRQLDAARENIESLVAEVETARIGVLDQQQQLDTARENIEGLVAEIATARTNGEIRERQIEELVASLEDRTRQVQERERREAALRTDVQRLSEQAGVLRSERDALAPALRDSQEAQVALSADRNRLAKLERDARERSALLNGRIAALQTDVHALRARDEANSAELARLSRNWYGRIARRLARAG